MNTWSKNTQYNLPFLLGAVALAGITVMSSTAYATAGRIQFVAGEVKLLNAKQIERLAQKGGIVDQGDVIITGTTGTLQVLMDDGGMIAVRPDTQMKIDAFKYTGKPDEANKSFFSLAKGTFRSITGAIGKANKQSYKVTTPDATIGIRGTVHQPTVVLTPTPNTPPQAGFGQVAPGTYDKVDSGEIYIQNRDGTVVVTPNQVGFASRSGNAPVILPNIPSFYNNSPPPTTQNLEVPGSVNTQPVNLSTVSDTFVSTSGAGSSTPTGNAATIGFTAAPIGSGMVGADTWKDANGNIQVGSGSIYIDGDAAKQVLLGLKNEVILVNNTSPNNNFQFGAGTASLVGTGGASTTSGAQIYWGRWENGFTVYDQGVLKQSVGSFHYMFSPDATPYNTVKALTGSATYTFAGGTAPTDQNGVAGVISSASLSANFTMQTISFGVTTVIAGNTLAGSASGSIADFTGTGITNVSTQTTKVNGLFVGAGAEGAITSFSISSGGTKSVGTAAFVK